MADEQQEKYTKQQEKINEANTAVSEIVTGDTSNIPSIDNNKMYKDVQINPAQLDEQITRPTLGSDYMVKRGSSSFVMKQDASVSMSVGNDSQLSVDGQSINQVSQTNRITANRLYIDADEIIINGHKLNNRIIELADFRELENKPGSVIGDFMVKGTVLVKSWEPNLGRYIFIRRNIHIPLFGKTTTPVEIDPGLKIKDPTKIVSDFAPFTEAMLAGQSPITEQSAKEAMETVNPQEDKLLRKNIFDISVDSFDTFQKFNDELYNKINVVKTAYQKQVEKGDPTAKNALEQVDQSATLLLNAAKSYYEKKK